MNKWMSMTNHPFHTQLLIILITDRKIIAYRVLIWTSLHVPSGLKSNSKYKFSFILESSLWNFTEQLLLSKFSPTYYSHCSAGFVSSTSSHPHNRGLEIKLGCQGPSPHSVFSSFPSSCPPLHLPPIQLRTTRPWGLTVPATCSAMGRLSLLLTSPSLDFTPGRIKSESFFPHSLWACSMPGCVRNMTPGVHRRRGRAEKN